MRNTTDFYPCPSRALYLKNKLFNHLLDGLEYMLDMVQSECKIDTHLAKDCLHKSRGAQYLSGYLFTLNQKLLSSLQNEDLEAIQICVEEIAKGNYLLSKMNIRNFDDEKVKMDWICESICIEEVCYPVPKSCSKENFLYTQEKLQEGLVILKEISPLLHEELRVFVSEFFIFDSQKLRSGSSFNLFGSLYFNYLDSQSNWLSILEDLVHEAAHLYIYTLTADNPLVLNKLEKIYGAPFREDKRPLIGIYHAVFVVSRLLYFFQHFLNSQHTLLTAYEDQIKERVRFLEDEFDRGLEIVEKDGILTPLAQELIQSTKAAVRANFKN